MFRISSSCFLSQIFIGTVWYVVSLHLHLVIDENILGLVIDINLFEASERDVCSSDTIVTVN